MLLWLEIDLSKGVWIESYGTKNSKSLSMHRSIYRHMLLWLEIDLGRGAWIGSYGT
jgi:hypothetical protein